MQIKDLEKIRETALMGVFVNAVLLISPGILAFFLLDKVTFLAMDWFKTLLLAVSFMGSVSFINLLSITAINPGGNFIENELKENSLYMGFTLSNVLTSMLLNLIIVFEYFLKYDFEVFLVSTILLSFILFIMAFSRNVIKKGVKNHK